ncbi:hypothetical protein CK203_071016 [Vitis vinifera]|uniref:Uncharacterized protein n=1 Tax=Vitis vinifera TaxID=29760 RepID=A0A438E9E2_VITVI|nr:hypothetical protein CK203_071016 [Vitis vinifera]
METFSSQQKTSFSELSSEITTLLDHSLDDIEAYVPPMIIEKMCEKTLQVRRIRISGRDGIRVTSAVKDLPQIRKRIDLYEVGRKWWNSKNIQKIVCSTGSTKFIKNGSGSTDQCSGHLLAVALMARALKMVFDVSIWEHASYILSLSHRSQSKDTVLYNALAFILGRSGSADKCVNYCAFYMEREGVDKVDLIQEWIRHALISTFDEGEKIVHDLVSAFLLESFQNGYFVQMRDEIREVLVNSQFLLQGGKGLTKAPKDDAWEEASEIHLMNNKFSELPRVQIVPNSVHCSYKRTLLCELFLHFSFNICLYSKS